jgi:hypothetical protein
MAAAKMILDRIEPAPKWNVNQDAGEASTKIMEHLKSFGDRLRAGECI